MIDELSDGLDDVFDGLQYNEVGGIPSTRRSSPHLETVCPHPIVRHLPSLTLVCGYSGLWFKYHKSRMCCRVYQRTDVVGGYSRPHRLPDSVLEHMCCPAG